MTSQNTPTKVELLTLTEHSLQDVPVSNALLWELRLVGLQHLACVHLSCHQEHETSLLTRNPEAT
jgi:hypothetical protein